MKIAYIAGSYTGKTTYEVRNNIRRAEKVQEWAWNNNYAAICPHTNTAFLDGMCDNQVWLTGYLNILQVCELMILVPNWEDSSGTKNEIELAKKIGIPVYEWWEDGEGNAGLEEYKG